MNILVTYIKNITHYGDSVHYSEISGGVEEKTINLIFGKFRNLPFLSYMSCLLQVS